MSNFRSPAVRFLGSSLLLALAVACTPAATPPAPTVKPIGTRSTLGKVTTPIDSTSAAPTPSATPSGNAASSSPGTAASSSPVASSSPGTASPTPSPKTSADANASGAASPTPTPSTSPTPSPTPSPASPVPTPQPLTVATLSLHSATGTAVTLANPAAMVADAAGNIYLAEATANTIHRFTAAGVDTIYAGTGAADYIDNANPLQAAFNSPSGLAIDAAGALYVSDANNGLIRKIAPNGGAVTTFAGGKKNLDGTYVGYADGPATGAQFGGPQGLALDSTDAANPVLYVSDSGNHMIRTVSNQAGVSTVATLAGTGTSGTAVGAFATATFKRPSGIALDAVKKLLYVVDSANHRLLKLDLAAKTDALLAGTGTAGYLDGQAATAQFHLGGRADLAFDTNGDLLLADSGNNCIRRISLGLAGTPVSTVAGQTTPGAADGVTISASFSGPTNLLRAGGVIYVSDAGNKSIRTLKP